MTMEMKSIEFFKTPEGSVMYKAVGEPLKELNESDREMVSGLLSLIRTRYPDAFKALGEIYSRYERNRWTYEFWMVSRFIRCNMGCYDTSKFDIDADGFMHFEQAQCPLLGCECKWEGVICKPRLDTKLTDREEEILGLIASGLQACEIGEKLCISKSTVDRHRENIKAKLGVRTIADLSKFYFEQLKK